MSSEASNKWRFLNTGFARGSWNMAVDEAILICHSEGKVPPTIRLYGWEPPALSLGRIQSFHRDVDAGACRKFGFDVVRRPTGGRAVLHDKEVTYSFVLTESHPLCPKQISEAFSLAAMGILKGLSLLGIEANIQGRDSRRRRDMQKGNGLFSPACFDSPSWYEIVVDGKKLVGSAQARIKGTLLQHGSILMELEPDVVSALFKLPSETVRMRVERELQLGATSISSILGRKVEFGEVLAAVRQGFIDFLRETFNITLEDGALTPDEIQLAVELEQQKYSTDSWNMLR